jgi:hypothetical protein
LPGYACQSLGFQIALGGAGQHAHTPNPFGLLGLRRHRPCGRRASQDSEKFSSSHARPRSTGSILTVEQRRVRVKEDFEHQISKDLVDIRSGRFQFESASAAKADIIRACCRSCNEPSPFVDIELHRSFASHFQQERLARFLICNIGAFHDLVDLERLLTERAQDILSIVQHE